MLYIYKKITDVTFVDGLIKPKKEIYAKITRCMIESDNVTIDEGNVSGRDQSFQYLDPIIYNK